MLWISLLGAISVLGQQQEITPDKATKPDVEVIEKLPRLETIDGRVYENLQDIKVAESKLSFRHDSGLASVELAKLPENMQKLFDFKPEVKAVVIEKLPRLETIDGKVYENLHDIRVTNSRINFQHDAGLASVLLIKLPEDLQKLCGYDPKRATTALAAEREAEAGHYAAINKAEAGKEAEAARVEAIKTQGILRSIELSREVSDYVRYESFYRRLAMEQREQDLKNAGDARYLKYGK